MHVILAETQSSGVAGVVGGIVGAMVSGWILQRVCRMGATTLGDVPVLRYHRSYQVIGWVCLLLFGTALVASQFSDEKAGTKLMCLAIFGFFVALGLLTLAMYHRSRLSWREETLEYVGVYGAPMTFTWGDVSQVKFSAVSQWWVLHLRDGRKARVSTYMPGAIDFMKLLVEKSGVTVPAAVLSNGQKVEFRRMEEKG